MDQPTTEGLAHIPLLADLDDVTRAALADRFEVEEFGDGRTIFQEGQAGYAFYVIASGRVSVRHGDDVLRELGPGEYFGEIAILGEGRRTATVTSVGPVVLWVLFGTEFRVLQTERPEVAQALEEAMRGRLAAG